MGKQAHTTTIEVSKLSSAYPSISAHQGNISYSNKWFLREHVRDLDLAVVGTGALVAPT